MSNCFPFASAWVHIFGRVRVAHLFICLCCPIVCLFVLSSVWCLLRFPHAIGVWSSLPAVVCRRAHVLFTLLVLAWGQWRPIHIVLCYCFVFPRLGCLDCPFLISPSVLSNVYLYIVRTKFVTEVVVLQVWSNLISGNCQIAHRHSKAQALNT